MTDPDPEPCKEADEAALNALQKFANRFGYHVDKHPVLRRYVAQEMEAFAKADRSRRRKRRAKQ